MSLSIPQTIEITQRMNLFLFVSSCHIILLHTLELSRHCYNSSIAMYCSVVFFQIRCMRELELPEVGTPPYLRSASLSSLSDLSPFFATLMFAQTSDGSNGHQSSGLSSTLWLSHVKGSTVAAVEDVIVQDFLESST